MSAIENLPFKVQRMQDVENVPHYSFLLVSYSSHYFYQVPGIGAGIKRRIEEYLVTEEEHGVSMSVSLQSRILTHLRRKFLQLLGMCKPRKNYYKP